MAALRSSAREIHGFLSSHCEIDVEAVEGRAEIRNTVEIE
jgi:hypothetical protein